MQADLSEDPAEARLLLDPIAAGRADHGARDTNQGTARPGALLPHQEFGNWVATSLIRVFYGYRYTDLGPFRAIRRDVSAASRDARPQLRLDHRDAGPCP